MYFSQSFPGNTHLSNLKFFLFSAQAHRGKLGQHLQGCLKLKVVLGAGFKNS